MGGPPDMISSKSTERLLKSIFGHCSFQIVGLATAVKAKPNRTTMNNPPMINFQRETAGGFGKRAMDYCLRARRASTTEFWFTFG